MNLVGRYSLESIIPFGVMLGGVIIALLAVHRVSQNREIHTPTYPLQLLRMSLIEKLDRSRGAWDRSVIRFRALHWTCLIGVIVLPTLLASLGKYMPDLAKEIFAVIVAIFGSIQAIVKPANKFLRDIEFRDETDFLMRQALTTDDPAQLRRLTQHFERVEQRFHQGQHPWASGKRAKGSDAWTETDAAASASASEDQQ